VWKSTNPGVTSNPDKSIVFLLITGSKDKPLESILETRPFSTEILPGPKLLSLGLKSLSERRSTAMSEPRETISRNPPKKN
jgi:hypothetical protein